MMDRRVKMQADPAEALHRRGVALARRGEHDEACRLLAEVVAQAPGSAEARSDLGSALRAAGRLEEALARYDEAVALAPGRAEVHHNRGLLLRALDRVGEALASQERAVALRPDFPEAVGAARLCRLLLAEAHWTEAQWRALVCEPAAGWDRDDWRRRERAFAEQVLRWPMPIWLGEGDVAGKRILVHAGDGLGNTLQLCRYVPLLAARGARVVLRAQRPLAPLLATLDGVEQVVPSGDPVPACDLHCPLLGLPLVFETRRDTIPATVPYLAAPADRVARWRPRLAGRARPRIGLVWSGGRAHRNDRRRSLALATLGPLLDAGADVVSLQKEASAEELGLLRAAGVLHVGDEQRDLADAAALVSLVDLVVSVDTSVAHLAGAMGAPVWVLLSFVHDWRWMLDCERTPWYPTARLFREEREDDRQGLVRHVVAELRRTVGFRGQI